MLAIFSLAQQVDPKVPPPRQPQEPLSNQQSLEVQIAFKGQVAEGIQVSLWELGPGGRLLLPKLRPNTTRTDGAGKVRWEGLGGGVWAVRIQNKDGFSLTLPALEEYLTSPSQVGPYWVVLQISKP